MSSIVAISIYGPITITNFVGHLKKNIKLKSKIN